jgi:hypothetical protein
MPFLHKLEQLYNGLIRLVTVLLTLALLGVAFKAALDWRRATAEPEPKVDAAQVAKTPKVATEDVVTRVVANQTGKETIGISSTDPNRAAYDRMSAAIHAFAQKHAVSAEDEDLPSQIEAIHYKVRAQDTDTLKTIYANGLADALEQSLADPRLGRLLEPGGNELPAVTPMALVSDVIDQYDTAFTDQHTSTADSTDAYEAQKQQQDAAWRSLARAGGPLLLAILVLQLLTFGRIERNTRGWHGESGGR